MPKSRLIFGNYDTNNTNGKVYKLKPMNLPTPERQTESFEVKGRSGSLLIDYGSYNNVTLEAEVGLESKSNTDSTIKLYDDVRSAIMRQTGYQRLEDSDYPGEYRMARSVGVKLDVAGEKNGSATLTFDAKPQRYLTSGETTALTVTPTDTPLTYTYGNARDILSWAALGLLDENQERDREKDYIVINLTNITDANSIELTYSTQFTQNAQYYVPYDENPYTSTVLCTWNGSPLLGETFRSAEADWFSYRNGETVWPDVKDSGDNMADYIAFSAGDFITCSVMDSHGRVIASWYPGKGTLTPSEEIVGMGPVFKVTPSGLNGRNAIYIERDSGGPITIINIDSSLSGTSPFYIDCETYNVYRLIGGRAQDLRNVVQILGDLSFTGDYRFTFNISPAVSSLEIIPRWWKI